MATRAGDVVGYRFDQVERVFSEMVGAYRGSYAAPPGAAAL
jgi:hypothetical protein